MGKIKYFVAFFLIFLIGITTTNAEIGFGNDEPRVDILTPEPEFVITSTTYLPDKINVTTGTLDSGNITSVQSAQDDDTFNVSEASGASPMTIIVNFSGVSDFNSIIMREKYSGGAGHEIAIGLYDPGTNSYEEEYGEITDMIGFAFTNIPVLDPQNHLNNGIVSLRLRHVNVGNPAHDFFLDYVSLVDGFTTVTTSDHDALSNRDSISNHPWACAEDGSRNCTLPLTSDFTPNFTSIFLKGTGTSHLELKAKATLDPSELTFDTLNGEHTLTVSGDAEVSQALTEGSTPTFANLITTFTVIIGSTLRVDETFGIGVAPSGNAWDIFIMEVSRANNYAGMYLKNTHATGISRFNLGMTLAESTFGVLAQYDKEDGRAIYLNRKSTTGTFDVCTTGGCVEIENDGNVRMPAVYSDDIGTERDLLINSTGSLGYDSSSIVFKENVENMTNEMSEKVYDLRVVTYDKINGSKNNIGLIAEEVNELYPEFISYKREEVWGECNLTPDDSYPCIVEYPLAINETTGRLIPETINYRKMVIPLIQEVQNQNIMINELEERISKLEELK